MNLAKSSIKLFAARVFKSVTSFVAVIVFSRALGADPLGIYYPFVALVGIALLPSDLGINGATRKRISENNDRGAHAGAAVIFKTPFVVAISIISLLLSEQINQFLGADLTLLFVAAIWADVLANFVNSVLKGELRVGETAILEVIKPICWLLVGYSFFILGYGVRGLVYGYISGSFLIFIIGWWKISIKIHLPKVRHIHSLFDYAKFSVISSVGGLVYSWVDVLILSFFVASSISVGVTRGGIGAYENAWRISLIVVITSKSISSVIFPQISRWDAENARDKIESAITTSLLPSIALVIPGFVGTLILSRDILRVLYGPDFITAWVALIILVGAKIPKTLHSILRNSLNAIDRPDLAAIASLVSIVLNILFNFILVWRFGLVGAAIATTASLLVNTILHYHFLSKILTIEIPLKNLGWCIISASIMGSCVFAIRSIVAPDGIISLLGIVGLGAIIYTPILLMYRPFRTETRRIMRPAIPDTLLQRL